MGTELYLILLAVCSAFINRYELPAALVFTCVTLLSYFICLGLPTLVILNVCMLAEMATIAFFVCLRGCSNSPLISSLIPVSIGMIGLHLYGVFLFSNEYSMTSYNEWVKTYYVGVILLFISRSQWVLQTIQRWKDGSFTKFSHLLRKHDSKSGVI